MTEFWAVAQDHKITVNSIVAQVNCEIGQAVRKVYYRGHPKAPDKNLEFIKTCGAQFTLILSVDDKSSLNPGLAINTPMKTATTTFAGGSTVSTAQSYSLGLGAGLSSEIVRSGTHQRFFPLSEFLENGSRYDGGRTDRTCISSAGLFNSLY
jgi:hypothetical protein